VTIELGRKPSEIDPTAQVRARAHEEAEAGHPAAEFRWIQAIVPALFSGALSRESLWHATPPSLAAVWEQHTQSARYFRLWTPLRASRYAWGGLHMVIAIMLYLAIWVTDSPPKALLAGLLVGTGFWLHIL
jgi:hypothetical protein